MDDIHAGLHPWVRQRIVIACWRALCTVARVLWCLCHRFRGSLAARFIMTFDSAIRRFNVRIRILAVVVHESCRNGLQGSVTQTLLLLPRRLTSLPYNTGGAGDNLDGMVLTPYTLPGQAYSQYNLGLSCAPRALLSCLPPSTG